LHLVIFGSVGPVEELTGASLLHDLSTSEACQFTEPVRAVHDGVQGRNLGVAEHEIAVCNHTETLYQQGSKMQLYLPVRH
jgi:hypothetical protein